MKDETTNTQFGTGNQSTVRLGEFRGEKAIIKSILHRDVPVLRRFEKRMIQREGWALRQLIDLEGVPEYLGQPDNYSIAIEYRPGTLLRNTDPGEIELSFLSRLECLVTKIHERGIVHSDLKKKENVMVDTDGQPVILDFGTHFSMKEGFRPINNFLYDQFRQMDMNAVSKLKSQFCPESMTERDHERLDSPTFLERADRFRRNYLFD